MKEKSILNQIQLMATQLGARLFRNNQGRAWTGRVHKLPDGSILIKEPRPITFGLSVGSGDLVGGTQVVVTPEMVGFRVFVFTNYEVKFKNTRTTTEQLAFHNMVISLGGISIIDKFNSSQIEGNSYSATINKFQGTC